MKEILISKKRLFALCVKETYQVARDPSSIIIAFLLPTILLMLFGYGINLDSTVVKLGVVIEDNSISAKSFVSAIKENPSFITTVSNNRKEIVRLMEKNKIRGMIIIPTHFSQNYLNNNFHSLIQVILDGTDPNTAIFVRGAVKGVWGSWLLEQNKYMVADSNDITVEERYWYNPSTKSRNFLVPGSIAIILTVIGTLLTSIVIAREWEKGTMESLLSTPINKIEFLLSKLIPYYILGIASLMVCLLLSIGVMGVPFTGSLIVLIIATTLFLVPSLGIGLYLSAATKNQFDAAQAALMSAFLPAVMLSGFIFEIDSMPIFLQFITYLFPATYYVNLLQNIFQAGTIPIILFKNFFWLLVLSFLWIGLAYKTISLKL